MIYFFTEDTNFVLKNKQKIKKWLAAVATQHDCRLKAVNYIFCSDNYLHQINVEYLQHDTFTDIITFDSSEIKNEIEGDIFISIDRLKENAITLQTSFEQEMARVMVHGILHLIGFGDKTNDQKTTMRQEENKALAMLGFSF